MTKRISDLFDRTAVVWTLFGLGLLAYVLLVLRSITSSSIWFDEAFGAYLIRFNYADVAHYTALDVHPPLYYWTLKTWQYAFGSSEMALRSMSLVFAVIALTFGFLLVKKWFGNKAALTALLFAILSPMMIRYGEEARMYTMVTAIALGATYVLSIALETRRKLAWAGYGVLVALGMLTHYFMALVWISHWVWRLTVTHRRHMKAAAWIKAACGGNWLASYVLAIVLFLPWLPYMLKQLGGIQASGFWISPVGIDSVTNFFTNFLFYQEHGNVTGWYAVAMLIVIGFVGILTHHTYRSMNGEKKQRYLLLIMMALIPLAGLFVASLPPMKSSFVERYLLPSYLTLALVVGVAFIYGRLARKLKAVAIVVLAGSLIVGIFNVYYYGNFNKNNSSSIETRRLVQTAMERSSSGEPIIASSTGLFYEAVFYATPDHQVYFIDEKNDYRYGSERMLRDNDQFKIKDMAAFAREHPKVWYIGSPDAPYPAWQKLQGFSFNGTIDTNHVFEAAEYEIH